MSKREFQSVWNYNLQAVCSVEDPDNLQINIDPETYVNMAIELGDRISTTELSPNIVLFDPTASYLALLLATNLSIGNMEPYQKRILKGWMPEKNEKILLVANENKNGKITKLAGEIKKNFQPCEIAVAVLFEELDLDPDKEADFSIYNTNFKVNFPIELSHENLSQPKILCTVADLLSSWIISEGSHSLDWNKALERLESVGFNTKSLPGLDNPDFAKLMLESMQKRFQKRFGKPMSSKLGQLLLPGIT